MHTPLAVTGLLSMFEVIRPAFTTTTFDKVRELSLGWILVTGPHTITAAIVAAGLAGIRPHAAWHRVFSAATWSKDEVGKLLFTYIVQNLIIDEQPVRLVGDDTLNRHRGPKIYGLGTHIDAVHSTRGKKLFAFGLVWVTLSVLVRLPMCSRPWALPIAFRLYRSKKECGRNGGEYRKKTELMLDLLTMVASWIPGRDIEALLDSGYAVSTIGRHLPPRTVLVGPMRPDAALYAAPGPRPPGARGRNRKKGDRLPTPRELAHDSSRPWQQTRVVVYGRAEQVVYKTLVAQWYTVCGPVLLRIVIVRVTSGSDGIHVYFSTDTAWSPGRTLVEYSWRWPVEVSYRDLRQFFGFGEAGVWCRPSVERLAPFVGLLWSMVVVWYAQFGHASGLVQIPYRPWYSDKTTVAFADMLAAAQRAVRLSGLTREVVWADLNGKRANPNHAQAQLLLPFPAPAHSLPEARPRRAA